MAEHNDFGTWGEDKAEAYLRRKGYEVIERDWRCGHRDIDIIAIDEDTLVFVEVKTRRNKTFADPLDAVDWKKRRNLTLAANAFVKMRRVKLDYRFDLITVVGTSDDDMEIDHIEDVAMD